MTESTWWAKPRTVSILVDNPSWILPFAHELADRAVAAGDHAKVARSTDEIGRNGVCFLLGCTRLVPPDILSRNQRNLIVHESDLPKGRGFAPLTWQVLEGSSEIPICLLEAAENADSGPVVYRDILRFEGHELNDELRAAQGRATVELCLKYLRAPEPPVGISQTGESSTYRRRTPEYSRLDPDSTIAAQFDLLRVVDNDRYPAFFELRGHRYRLRIEKEERE